MIRLFYVCFKVFKRRQTPSFTKSAERWTKSSTTMEKRWCCNLASNTSKPSTAAAVTSKFCPKKPIWPISTATLHITSCSVSFHKETSWHFEWNLLLVTLYTVTEIATFYTELVFRPRHLRLRNEESSRYFQLQRQKFANQKRSPMQSKNFFPECSILFTFERN